MTDVRLFHTPDGGDVNFENGNPEMSSVEVETAAYLSMFGGNEKDNGTEATKHLQYWGNLIETDPARRYRSRTQARILGSANLASDIRDIENAATADLQWFVDEKIASSVGIAASVIAYNTIALAVSIAVDDKLYSFVFQKTVNI